MKDSINIMDLPIESMLLLVRLVDEKIITDENVISPILEIRKFISQFDKIKEILDENDKSKIVTTKIEDDKSFCVVDNKLEDFDNIKNSKFYDIIKNNKIKEISDIQVEELKLFILNLTKDESISIISHILEHDYSLYSYENNIKIDKFLTDKRFKSLYDIIINNK